MLDMQKKSGVVGVLKKLKIIFLVMIMLIAFTSFLPETYARDYNETIEGSSTLTSRQMGDYVLLLNQYPLLMGISIYQLADLYLTIGRLEGIRGDIAFAQAIKETGNFEFGGDVFSEQNNYAGIGTTGNGVIGLSSNHQKKESGHKSSI
jgi:hypothetical protein